MPEAPVPEPGMLDMRHARKVFHPGTPMEVHALEDVSLSLPEASFAVIIGTNGSGKSTLLNAIAGSFFLDSGEIRIAGTNVARWPEYRRASLIGRVFQDPFKGTAAGLSIAENMALAATRGQHRGLRPMLNGSLRRQIGETVRALNIGLEGRLDDAMGSLSGGQRQALTLMMATWLKPRVLLLDEPTAALDPKSAEKVIEIAGEIFARDRLTTIMVTHSMQHAAMFGDRLIMMHRGRAIYDISGEEKKDIRPAELLERFEELRRCDISHEADHA